MKNNDTSKQLDTISDLLKKLLQHVIEMGVDITTIINQNDESYQVLTNISDSTSSKDDTYSSDVPDEKASYHIVEFGNSQDTDDIMSSVGIYFCGDDDGIQVSQSISCANCKQVISTIINLKGERHSKIKVHQNKGTATHRIYLYSTFNAATQLEIDNLRNDRIYMLILYNKERKFQLVRVC